MPLPIFPVFGRLSDTSRVHYQHSYGRLSAPYSDFSLNNVLIWLDQKGDLELSAHGDCLVLRFASPFENNRRRYALFGTGSVDGAIRDVLEFMQAQGEDVGLCMVPEETVRLIDNTHGLHVVEESWNADYVIRVEATFGLKGQRYDNLRRRVRSIESRHPSIEGADLDLRDERTNALVRRSVDGWMSNPSSRPNDPGGVERLAIARHLDLAGSIPIHALGAFIGDRLVSVSIYHHPPHPGWVVVNHVVCDPRYRGAFGYSFHQVIRTAYTAGKNWLNAEQDLGRPGLRRAKLLLRPHHFLRRYSVSLATEGD